MLLTFSCQPNKQKSVVGNSIENENPIIGTWQFLGAIDSSGNEVEYFSGENTYFTALENGQMIEFGFRKNFPDSISSPPTCEQLLEIYNESFGNILHYTYEGDTLRYSTIQSTHPDQKGTSFEVEIEFIEDQLVAEYEGTVFKYKRVH
jgi:hypothetical protein